jgi:hypothetical protein
MGSPARISSVLFLLPVVLVPAVWWPTLGHSFQFDDWNVIVGNPAVHGLEAWRHSLPGIRPLLTLSYAANHALGTGPEGFCAVNILIHAVNTLLVALLGHRRLSLWGVPGLQAAGFAAVAALVFALHPAQTEAVTYISGRSSALAALFALASLLAWDRGTRPDGAPAWLAAAGLFAVLAVAAKETAAVLPLALWLWSAGERASSRLPGRRILLLAAMFALSVTALAAGYAGLLRFSMGIRPVGANLLAQFTAVPYLLSHVVCLGRIDIDPAVPQTAGWMAASAAFWLAAGVLVFAPCPGRTVGRFAVLWVLLWLAPTNSVIPRLDPVNDRHLYLPLAGLAWAAAWLAWRIWRRSRPVAVVAVACVAVLLLTATAVRNRDYATELSLWRRTAAQNPLSARAANNLGFALASRCAWADADAQFRRALALDPAQIEAAANLSLLRSGRFGAYYPTNCAAP